MRTVILCGGRGTRAYPHTVEVPKPLLEVAGRPMLHHVMKLYTRRGFHDFVLAAGYKVEMVRAFAETLPDAWSATVVDTGEDTDKGERLWRCRDLVGDEFFVNYSDGLGDVDLNALLGFHHSHPGAATITTVPLPSQYGTIEFDDANRVAQFHEKPQLRDHWINAGFFVFDRRVWDLWEGEDLEGQVLPRMAEAGELFAYTHEGFWKSADTFKDTEELGRLWEQGAPWEP